MLDSGRCVEHMARGDDLHAIKYLPLKLKGPARHWLNSLPAESISCWEDLEAAFLDNFQGTYVRPPDADDLSHIIQQPKESARQFWTRFLTKKNKQDQSMDHVGAPRRVTITITPDTVKVSPAGPNTTGKTHSSCVAI